MCTTGSRGRLACAETWQEPFAGNALYMTGWNTWQGLMYTWQAEHLLQNVVCTLVAVLGTQMLYALHGNMLKIMPGSLLYLRKIEVVAGPVIFCIQVCIRYNFPSQKQGSDQNLRKSHFWNRYHDAADLLLAVRENKIQADPKRILHLNMYLMQSSVKVKIRPNSKSWERFQSWDRYHDCGLILVYGKIRMWG